MMVEVALGDGFADRGGKVHEGNSEVSGAWIIEASLETRRRQLDERMMLADSDCLRHRRDLSHQRPGFTFTGERKSSFDFRVLRKIPGVREIESAARGIEP